jgi:hypothetical protein
MMRFHALGAVTFLLAAGGLLAQEAAKETPYYPLKKGNSWTYKVMDKSITMKVAGQEKDGTKVETLVDDKSVAAEHVLVKEDGVYRTSINGQKPDAPVLFLKLPPKKGDSWTVDTKIQGQDIKGKFTTDEEEVTVPAGKYKTFKVTGKDFQIAGMKTDITYWFAEKVGIVKLSFGVAGTSATLELEKFVEGK